MATGMTTSPRRSRRRGPRSLDHSRRSTRPAVPDGARTQDRPAGDRADGRGDPHFRPGKRRRITAGAARGRRWRPRSGRRPSGSLHGGRDGVADADHAGDGKKERCEDHGSSTQGRTRITAAGDAQSSRPGRRSEATIVQALRRNRTRKERIWPVRAV